MDESEISNYLFVKLASIPRPFVSALRLHRAYNEPRS